MRLECLRLLAALKLDPARSRLIGGFIETYLRLTAEEMRRYEREFTKLAPEEQAATVEITNSWEQRGIEQGIQTGKEDIALRLIDRRFGSVPANIKDQFNHLSSEQLTELCVALLDFKTSADLEMWLSQHEAQ